MRVNFRIAAIFGILFLFASCGESTVPKPSDDGGAKAFESLDIEILPLTDFIGDRFATDNATMTAKSRLTSLKAKILRIEMSQDGLPDSWQVAFDNQDGQMVDFIKGSENIETTIPFATYKYVLIKLDPKMKYSRAIADCTDKEMDLGESTSFLLTTESELISKGQDFDALSIPPESTKNPQSIRKEVNAKYFHLLASSLQPVINIPTTTNLSLFPNENIVEKADCSAPRPPILAMGNKNKLKEYLPVINAKNIDPGVPLTTLAACATITIPETEYKISAKAMINGNSYEINCAEADGVSIYSPSSQVGEDKEVGQYQIVCNKESVKGGGIYFSAWLNGLKEGQIARPFMPWSYMPNTNLTFRGSATDELKQDSFEITTNLEYQRSQLVLENRKHSENSGNWNHHIRGCIESEYAEGKNKDFGTVTVQFNVLMRSNIKVN